MVLKKTLTIQTLMGMFLPKGEMRPKIGEGEWGHGDEGGESKHGEDDPVIEQNANPPQPITVQKSSNHPQDFC